VRRDLVDGRLWHLYFVAGANRCENNFITREMLLQFCEFFLQLVVDAFYLFLFYIEDLTLSRYRLEEPSKLVITYSSSEDIGYIGDIRQALYVINLFYRVTVYIFYVYKLSVLV
jgi:hypothetical protein